MPPHPRLGMYISVKTFRQFLSPTCHWHLIEFSNFNKHPGSVSRRPSHMPIHFMDFKVDENLDWSPGFINEDYETQKVISSGVYVLRQNWD